MLDIQSVILTRPRVNRYSVLLLVILILLIPEYLLAESAPEFQETGHAKKVVAEALKTPEEFLLEIKTFLENQNMDTRDFIEKLTCIKRDKWKYHQDHIKWYRRGDLSKRDSHDVLIYDYTDYNASVPFRSIDMLIEKNRGFLMVLQLSYPMDSFHLTPSDIRAVFGAPKRIHSTSPRSEFSVGQIYVYYKYNFGEYELTFYTEDTLQYFKKIKHLQGKRISPRAYMEKFENHADYRIDYVTIKWQ